MVNRKAFQTAIKKIEENKKRKKTPEEKAQETRMYTQRLAEMRAYICKSEEKRQLLLDTINSPSPDDESVTLLEKGVIIYVEFLEAIDLICKDLEKENIQYMYVTGEVSTKGRGEVCDWFKEDARNKVVIISSAGGESLNLNFTNELILYSTPKGYAKFVQVIGRVDRSFGKYEHFNIHFIEVEDTTDTYEQILLSSRKELEMELLTQDVIPVKEVCSFDQTVLKEFRKHYLWKERASKPKIKSKKEGK